MPSLEKIPVSLSIPLPNNENKRVKYQLCHVDHYLTQPTIIQAFDQGLPSNNPTKNIREGRLTPHKGHQDRRDTLNYEENNFTLVHISKTVRYKIKQVIQQAESRQGRRIKTEPTNSREIKSISRLKTCANEESDSANLCSISRRSPSRHNSYIQDPRWRDAEVASWGERKKKRTTIAELVSLKNKKRREYEDSKLSRMDIIPDYVRFSSKKANAMSKHLSASVNRHTFSNYKVWLPACQERL